MPTYECDYCNYSTIIISHYNKHLNTKKHNKKIKELDAKLVEKLKSHKNEHKMSTNEHKINNSELFCIHCNKLFTTIAIKRRHELHYCKIKKKNDKMITELENKYKDELQKQEKFYVKEIEKLEKKIENLINKNRTTIINIDKQINLNSYGNEDMTHITEKFKDQMLKIPFVAIPKMIEEVHFNEKKPENNNIKLTNKKENYVKVYQGDKWIFKDKKATIKQLMDDKYTIIDNHYEESKDEPKPEHVESQYKKFKEMYADGDKELHNEIRVDCELLLLNNME